MPKRLRTNAIEREGVNFVRGVVERANSIFNEIHRENDYGNDAFVELVDGESVTGVMTLLQIKSGKTYCTPSECIIPATREQIAYWMGHRLPVIGIVYDPGMRTAFWTTLSEGRRGGIARPAPAGPIRFAKGELNRFDDGGFRDYYLPHFLRKPILVDKERSVRFALSDSYDEHQVGIRSLFYGYRNDQDTWLIFEKLLRERGAEETSPFLAYLMAHVPWHGDIVGGKDSVLSPDIREFVRERMRRYDKAVVLALLRLVDDRGYERGTPGQSVAAVLDLNDHLEQHLDAIVNEDGIELATREQALTLLCVRLQERAEPVLRALTQHRTPLSRWAGELHAHLKREGFFYPY